MVASRSKFVVEFMMCVEGGICENLERETSPDDPKCIPFQDLQPNDGGSSTYDLLVRTVPRRSHEPKRPNSACYLHLCATSLVLLSETEAVGMDPASAHRNDCNGCHPVCNAASHRANLPMKSTQHLSMNRQSKLENLAVARHTCHHPPPPPPPPPTMTMTIVHSKAHHTSSRASAQILGVPRFFQH